MPIYIHTHTIAQQQHSVHIDEQPVDKWTGDGELVLLARRSRHPFAPATATSIVDTIMYLASHPQHDTLPSAYHTVGLPTTSSSGPLVLPDELVRPTCWADPDEAVVATLARLAQPTTSPSEGAPVVPPSHCLADRLVAAVSACPSASPSTTALALVAARALDADQEVQRLRMRQAFEHLATELSPLQFTLPVNVDGAPPSVEHLDNVDVLRRALLPCLQTAATERERSALCTAVYLALSAALGRPSAAAEHLLSSLLPQATLASLREAVAASSSSDRSISPALSLPLLVRRNLDHYKPTSVTLIVENGCLTYDEWRQIHTMGITDIHTVQPATTGEKAT